MRWNSFSLALRGILSLTTIIAIAVVLSSCSGGGKEKMMIKPPPPPGPDLVVISVVGGPSTATVGDSFRLNATIRNRGDQGAGTTVLTFHWSTDSTISPADTAIGSRPVKALAAGESVSVQTTQRVSQVGTYYYGACVDRVGGEADVRNNCSAGTRVVVDSGPAPDLTLYRFSVSATTVNVGDRLTLDAVVKNVGTGTSGRTTLRYFRSRDSRITPGDSQVETDSVSSLSAGQTADENARVTASTPGTYYYGACVDSVSGEPNQTNNCSRGLAVTAIQPQLYGALALTTGSFCPEYGVAVANYTNSAAAQTAARRICENTYNVGCVTFGFNTTCGAVVYGSSFFSCQLYTGYGNTRGSAENQALNRCLSDYSSCVVRDWDCSSR